MFPKLVPTRNKPYPLMKCKATGYSFSNWISPMIFPNS